jgi:hypothetical protein
MNRNMGNNETGKMGDTTVYDWVWGFLQGTIADNAEADIGEANQLGVGLGSGFGVGLQNDA